MAFIIIIENAVILISSLLLYDFPNSCWESGMLF